MPYGSSGHVSTCPKDKYCHAYFEALELGFGEVDRRFEQSDNGIILTIIESLLLDASNGKPVQISDDINTFLKNDLNQDDMKVQLHAQRYH